MTAVSLPPPHTRSFEGWGEEMADFGKLPTYPSPKRTLTLSSYLGQNVGVGEGWQFRLQEDAIFVTVVINWKCWRLFQHWFMEIRIQPVTRRSEKSRLSMERTYFFVLRRDQAILLRLPVLKSVAAELIEPRFNCSISLKLASLAFKNL